ncbi:MAG: 3-oxoacyl-[acyl-carrier-protein] reductase FabG [Chlamydiae bacterium]|nr:3-oxoacyl-[acyl-carrier-protein] reductase FabG [Chlamydiota bacterium]
MQEIRASGGLCDFYALDVQFEDEVQNVIHQITEDLGHLDVICHNAGIYPEKRLEDMSLENWREVIDVNLTGTFNMVRAAIPTMKSQGHGKIVVTSSISGPITALPGFSHYTASKGGVEGFVKTAAVELAKYNIQINTVLPGNILTEGLSDLGPEYLESMTQAIPAGVLGNPKDIGYAALFLASDKANFITGQSLVVDGGQTLPESHFSDY